MTTSFLLVLLTVLVFALGVLTGHGYTTRAQDARDRRQAATQRGLNLWQRNLREMAERQAAKEEELRWRYLEQAGLTVIDHDQNKEVSRKDQQLPRTVRRPARWQW